MRSLFAPVAGFVALMLITMPAALVLRAQGWQPVAWQVAAVVIVLYTLLVGLFMIAFPERGKGAR